MFSLTTALAFTFKESLMVETGNPPDCENEVKWQRINTTRIITFLCID
jgi:hypothetical protein